jgi:hypothetical protein
MKNIFFTLALLVSFASFGQSKKELRKRNSELISEYNELVEEYNSLYEKHSVSFDTPENYAKSIFKLLKNKNKNEAYKLLLSTDDSNYFSDKLNEVLKKEADRDSLSIRDWIQRELNDDSKKSFDKVYYEGINLGINWQSAVFTKAEFKIEYEAELDTYLIDDYSVFFKSSNKDYSFNIGETFIIDDKPKNWSLSGPYDIQAQKLKQEIRERESQERKKQEEIELKNKPYLPWGFSVGKTSWSYELSDKMRFTEFRIRITNNTKFYVNKVKFQVSISTDSQGKVFGKTYDKSVYLEPGDVKTIKISELNYFYVGEDVSNQENWDIDHKVLDVFPKHNK